MDTLINILIIVVTLFLSSGPKTYAPVGESYTGQCYNVEVLTYSHQ